MPNVRVSRVLQRPYLLDVIVIVTYVEDSVFASSSSTFLSFRGRREKLIWLTTDTNGEPVRSGEVTTGGRGAAFQAGGAH